MTRIYWQFRRKQSMKKILIIGKIEEKHWAGIITYRNENIRIISVRRARNEEIMLYES